MPQKREVENNQGKSLTSALDLHMHVHTHEHDLTIEGRHDICTQRVKYNKIETTPHLQPENQTF